MADRRLRDILRALGQNVRDLEAALGERRPIDQGVLDELGASDLPTSALARRLRRRENDVRAVLLMLEAQGQVRRVGRRWALTR
jgi:hypothetical protein